MAILVVIGQTSARAQDAPAGRTSAVVADSPSDDAVQEARRRAAAQPADDTLKLALARVLSWNKALAESIEIYRFLLQRRPDDRVLRVELARVLSWAGQYEEAIESYADLLKAAPDDDELLREEARVLSWAGRFQPSIDRYRRLLQRNRSRELQLELAAVYVWSTRWSDAMPIFERVLAEDPYDKDALVGLAQIHAETGNRRRAKEFYERALAEEDDVAIHRGLARLYRQDQAWEQAQAEYRLALDLEPDNREVRDELDDLDLAQGPALRVRWGRYEDANRFIRRDNGVDVAYHGWRASSVRLGASRSHYEDAQGASLSRMSYSLLGTARWGAAYRVAGGYTLHRDDRDSAAAHLLRVQRTWDHADLSVESSRYHIIDAIESFDDNFYSTLTTIASIQQGLSARELRLEGRQRVSRMLETNGAISRGRYNDGNTVSTVSLKLTSPVHTDPDLGLYYTFFMTDFDVESPLYWSPSAYQAHGLGVTMSYRKRGIGLTMDESVFYQSEGSVWGNALLAAVDYRLSKRIVPKLTVFFFDSDIRNASFHAWNTLVSLTASF